MPGAAMTLLAARLARAGYAPRVFAYRGRSSFEANCERFARYVQDALRSRPAHYIGHSLGGVLVLEMLNRHREIPVASAVLLGSPVRGCMAGRRFGTGRFGRWMLGACGDLWQERDAAWRRDAPLGVIAGTLPLGLGRAFGGRLPGANDGVVRVEETAVKGMSAQALVPTGHSLLIVSGAVDRLVERFLNTGRFE
jgi:pimeloyl-ACP methyl ester carboxylesterase